MPKRGQDEDRSQRVEGACFRSSSADIKPFLLLLSGGRGRIRGLPYGDFFYIFIMKNFKHIEEMM